MQAADEGELLAANQLSDRTRTRPELLAVVLLVGYRYGASPRAKKLLFSRTCSGARCSCAGPALDFCFLCRGQGVAVDKVLPCSCVRHATRAHDKLMLSNLCDLVRLCDWIRRWAAEESPRRLLRCAAPSFGS